MYMLSHYLEIQIVNMVEKTYAYEGFKKLRKIAAQIVTVDSLAYLAVECEPLLC